MSRRSKRNHRLIGILGPLWFLCVALHLDRQLSPTPLAWVPVYVEPMSGGFPIVTGYWPDTPQDEQVVEPGDHLLSAGGRSLRDVGRVGFWAQLLAVAGPSLVVPVRVERGNAVREVELRLRRLEFPWRTLPLSLALGLAALLVLARSGETPAARTFAIAAISYSIQWSLFFGGAPWATRAGLAVFVLAGAFYQPLTLRAALLFPAEVASSSRILHALCWVFSITAFGLWVWLFGTPLSGEIGLRILGASYGIWILLFLGVLVRNYRRATGRGRRQLRWVLYGFVAGLTPAAAGSAALGFRPDLQWLYELSLLPTIVIPACIYIALVRYRLYDIDRLITTTIAYMAVAPVFLSVLLSAGVPLAELAQRHLGIQRMTAFWVLSFAVAVPVPLLARFLRPQIDRLFFRERFRFELGIRDLRNELTTVASAHELWKRLGERLNGLIALRSLVIYARTNDIFVPVYTHGVAPPDGFDAEGGFCALVADARGAIGSERVEQWMRAGSVAVTDRESLEELEPQAIVPLYRGDLLDAFVSLGEKRSGDVFTRTDLALLESLAERVSLQLGRFDEDQRFSMALEEANASQRERVVWLENFARFLRHELKNQLVGIESSLDLARRSSDAAQRAQLLSRGTKSASVMSRILRAASEATSVESALTEEEFEPLDLAEVAEATSRDCLAARSDREIVFAGPCVLRVRGNEPRLVQMFEKILHNACDHCAPGGRVDVIADRWSGRARVRIRNPGDHLPADAESLFEPFKSQRAARVRSEENLGIGLYVARQIARGHGGDVEARSLPTGAEFEVWLPLLED